MSSSTASLVSDANQRVMHTLSKYISENIKWSTALPCYNSLSVNTPLEIRVH